jgi:hypothetical protein
MKMITVSAVILAASTFMATSAMAGECSTETLKGHYTYWLRGSDSAGKPFAEVGQEEYDGAGKVVSKIGVAGEVAIEDAEGTYTVNDDCTGTVSYASGDVYNIFVAPSGDSFVFSAAAAGVIEAGENSRVAAD